jgi:hypothetical protein
VEWEERHGQVKVVSAMPVSDQISGNYRLCDMVLTPIQCFRIPRRFATRHAPSRLFTVINPDL